MRVMISCGEPSGDLYAAGLIEALRARVPSVEVFGFGGRRFERAGGLRRKRRGFGLLCLRGLGRRRRFERRGRLGLELRRDSCYWGVIE